MKSTQRLRSDTRLMENYPSYSKPSYGPTLREGSTYEVELRDLWRRGILQLAGSLALEASCKESSRGSRSETFGSLSDHLPAREIE